MRDPSQSGSLLVYIEPTGYVVAQIDALRNAWPGRVDPLFLTENLSQDWGISPSGLGGRRLSSNRLAAVAEIWNLLRSGRYNLVHLAGWGDPLQLTAMLIAWARGIPVTIESDTFEDSASSSLRRMIKRLLYPRLFRLPGLFLPGGHPQSDYLARFEVPSARRRVAQMTVNVEGIRSHHALNGAASRRSLRAALGIPEAATVFIFVGRLELHKGVKDLLIAFDNLGSPDRHLLIVGDGTLNRSVKDFAERNTCIHALGRLGAEDLLAAYAASDVLVLPSHREPWGLVVNEALACDLPVLVSDRVGCAYDLVMGRGSGLIFQAQSVEELTDALRRMSQMATGRHVMVAAARETISKWTMSASAALITSAWREVLSK